MNTKDNLYRVKPHFKASKKEWTYINLDELIKGGQYCEVFEGEDLVKFYFDFDFKNLENKDIFEEKRKLIIEDYYNDLLELFINYFDDIYCGDVEKLDIAISDSSYWNTEKDNKVSFHFVLIGLSCKFRQMKKLLLDIDKDIFNKFNLDESVYKPSGKSQGMRAINNSKSKDSTKLKPINYKDDLKKHIIQDIYDGNSDINLIYLEDDKIDEDKLIEELYENKNPEKNIYNLDEFEKQLLKLIDYNSYFSWFRVAAVLKSIGCPPYVFHKWAKQSTKYKKLENEKLWNNIKSNQCKIGTLYYLANHKQYGNPAEYKLINEKFKHNFGPKKDKELYKYSVPQHQINNLLDNMEKDAKYDLSDIESIINASNYDLKEEIKNYYKYKPTIDNVIKPDIIINQNKLDVLNEDGTIRENFINKYDKENYKLIVIKSDTGTGKTTSVNNYFELLENTNDKLISITSRVSLAEAHYKLLQDKKKRVRIYNKDKLCNFDNIIIQLDSIVSKLYKIDYSNYIVYLDEFSSILEYLHRSSTLDKSRLPVYKRFIKILRSCKKVIMVDADIDDICLEWLTAGISDNRLYIKNEFQNNKDVESQEITQYDDIVELMKKDLLADGFCCACDSKNVAQDVYNLIIKDYPDKKDDILLITDEYKGFIDMDAVKCVIYSPKVIYGIDSTLNRNVYAIYKEHTISPRAMYQQISRTRKIKKLFLYFHKKTFNYSFYNSLSDIEREINEIERYTSEMSFFEDEDESLKNLFKNTYKKYLYNEDAFKTNKFCHCINILKEKGVKCDDLIKVNNKKVFLDYQKAHQQLKRDNFDINNYYVKEQNKKYLKMTDDEILRYQDYYLTPQLLDGHFLYCKYFIKNKNDFISGLYKIKDFNLNKASNSKVKLYFLNKIQTLFKLDRKEFYINTSANYELPYSELKELDREYKIIFRSSCKASFTSPEGINILIPRIFRSIFGNECLSGSRKTINGKKITVYNWNEEYYNTNNEIYNIRNDKYKERRQEEVDKKINIFNWKDTDLFLDCDDEDEDDEYNLLDVVIS